MKNVIYFFAFLMASITTTLNAQPFIDATGTIAPLSQRGIIYASLKLSDTNVNGLFDAAFALSETNITDWPDYSCVLAFYGTLTTRNGNTMVPSTVKVEAGKWYDIWFDINVNTKTYAVYYKTSEMTNHALVADNLAFRKTAISSINRWSCMHNIQGEPDFLTAKSVGMVNTVGEYPNQDNISNPELAKGSAIVNFAIDLSKYDKKKVLNVARGGHGINTNLAWMPIFNDNLVEIGIDEFRVDWILADWFYKVVSRDNQGRLKYDFSKLDQVILPMVNKGIKPMMCMCYMALALGPEKGEPKNYDEYKSTIKAFVKHYKDLGHTGWAWESHNEPEGFTNLTPQQTYKMYKYFAEGVKEVDNTARVGGFGAVGPDWLGYINTFLTEYKNDTSKPMLDFFSFHQYGKSSWDYVPVIEKAFTDKGLPIPPFYLTEWNNTWGNGLGEGNGGVIGGGYDTEVNASYVAKKLFNSLGYQNLKKIYYWNFADHDPNKRFSGGSGLFTVDGHWKASANTFYFYNKLHSQIVSSQYSGTGSAQRNFFGIATRSETENKMAMILWNYQNTNIEVDIALNSLPKLPEGHHYKINKYSIDKKNGNYYYDYLQGHTGKETGPHEKVSVVNSYDVQGNNFNHTDTIPAYGVVQFIIEPSSVSSSVHPLQKDQQIALSAYPTLFDNWVNISYTQNNNKNIVFSIFDINGQIVGNIKPGVNPPGKHSLRYDGSHLIPGIYFLKYQGDTNTETVKILKR